ncbi:MAG: Rossmann-like and DUF2520 domain-containing protein [Candidatus Saccharicenans sp.]
MKNFSIIGAGQVGKALALALTKKGYKLKVVSDSNFSRARRVIKVAGQGKATTDNRLTVKPADLIFICVPDDALSGVITEISKQDFQKKIVFHTSGACSSSLLEPLARKGAITASFHPIQTFAGGAIEPEIFKGIFIGLEGQTAALKAAKQLARKLGAQILLIGAEEKPIYHLACSIASNFLVVIILEVKELLKSLGLEEKAALEILCPLLNKTLQNVKKIGIEPSLTGPVVRGDLKTVKKHLTITGSNRELDNIYRSLALEALKVARKRGLTEDKIRALRQLLEQK